MRVGGLMVLAAAILAAQAPVPTAPTAPTVSEPKAPAKGQITSRVNATAPSYKTLKFGPPPPLKLPISPRTRCRMG